MSLDPIQALSRRIFEIETKLEAVTKHIEAQKLLIEKQRTKSEFVVNQTNSKLASIKASIIENTHNIRKMEK